MPRNVRSTTSDFSRVRATADADIDYTDSPELTKDWFSRAELRAPAAKVMVSIRLDADVLGFFRKGGGGYQTRINQVLRSYKEAHETHGALARNAASGRAVSVAKRSGKKR